MKTRRRLRWLGILLCAALLAAVVAFVPFSGLNFWEENQVATGNPTDDSPLKDHLYDMPPDQTLEVAAAVASRLPNWRVTTTKVHEGIMVAVVTNPIALYNDTIMVSVWSKGRSTEVAITSQWRVSRDNIEKRGQHILELQNAMDGRLNRVSTD